jgi:hypothetical protein
LLLILILVLLILIQNIVNNDAYYFFIPILNTINTCLFVLWFFVCLVFKQYVCSCCITLCFSNIFSITHEFVLLCHYATFLKLRRECHIRNLFQKVVICTNSYQNRMQFDLFRTSSKLSLIWVGVHYLQSLGCSQKL